LYAITDISISSCPQLVMKSGFGQQAVLFLTRGTSIDLIPPSSITVSKAALQEKPSAAPFQEESQAVRRVRE